MLVLPLKRVPKGRVEVGCGGDGDDDVPELAVDEKHTPVAVVARVTVERRVGFSTPKALATLRPKRMSTG